MHGNDIAWGFGVGLLIDQDTFHIVVLVRTVDTVYPDCSKGRHYRYTIFDGNRWTEWKTGAYAFKNDEPKLIVETRENSTTLRWGPIFYGNRPILLSSNKHCDGISYVELEVLPQSRLVLGDAKLSYEKIDNQGRQVNVKKTDKPTLTR